MEEFAKFANNRVFLALLVIFNIPLFQDNQIFWTARGKTFVNFLEDTIKYLLAFSEAYYTLNSRSYLLIKLYPSMAPYLVMKMSKITQERKFALILSPMCAARGKMFLILAIYTYR